MTTADNPLYYIDPAKFDIQPNYNGDARAVNVINREATIQVYSTEVPNFATKENGQYKTYRIIGEGIYIGDGNWNAMTGDEATMYIYARIMEPTDQKREAQLIFTLTDPETYPLEGIPAIIEEGEEQNELSRTHYILLGTINAVFVEGEYSWQDRYDADMSFDTGYLGTDRYIEEFDIRPMFTNEVEENTERHYTRQKQPMRASVIYSGQAFNAQQYPVQEGDVWVLNPDKDGVTQFLLNAFGPGTICQLPIAQKHVGLEYTFIGFDPNYGTDGISVEGEFDGYNMLITTSYFGVDENAAPITPDDNPYYITPEIPDSGSSGSGSSSSSSSSGSADNSGGDNSGAGSAAGGSASGNTGSNTGSHGPSTGSTGGSTGGSSSGSGAPIRGLRAAGGSNNGNSGAGSSEGEEIDWDNYIRDKIFFLQGREKVSVDYVRPPYPCILRFIATFNGWVMMQYEDPYWH